MTVKESCYNAATNPGDLLCSAKGAVGSATGQDDAENRARNIQLGVAAGTSTWGQTGGPARIAWQTHRAAEWQALADTLAEAACRARGYRLVSATFGPGHDARKGQGTWLPGDNLGWFYSENKWTEFGGQGTGHAYQAWQSRTWTATCKKTVRRTRK